MNIPKSLYITISHNDYEIYFFYIKIIITFLNNKIKKYYNHNKCNINSVLFIINENNNNELKQIFNCNFDIKNILLKKISKTKLNLPIISSRINLLKECNNTLVNNKRKNQWYSIPEERYMQDNDVIIEPLYVSKVPANNELNEIQNIFSINNYEHEDYNEIKHTKLFHNTEKPSSDNNDADSERNKNNIEVIFFEKIKYKMMYYTPKNEKEIYDLQTILSHSKFNKLMNSFKQKNTRKGVICVFSGGAGTGKTETVLQLARSCQRNIVKYDATQISSSLLGVSSNNAKEIFKSYDKVMKNSKYQPILLLNEADSIFTKRINLGGSSNDIGNLDENRTQTILLESIENFDGILIATTNIITNFDPAFERRFLYKINFDKPDKNARLKILQFILPELKNDEQEFIANNYELTGAQIENISRKLVIKEVINDKTSFEDIMNLCKDEIDNCFTSVNKMIGFK